MRMRTARSIAVISLALVPATALAHTGHSGSGSFLDGMAHPMGGLDHIVAMVMVGILAAQLGGRALTLLPLSFLFAMVIGGAMGVAGLTLPFVEAGIALSAVVLGIAVASGTRAPAIVAVAVVDLFALFHGHAHGTEMPPTAHALGYALGFVAATAILHAAGICLGAMAAKLGTPAMAITRLAGVFASCAGVVFLGALI